VEDDEAAIVETLGDQGKDLIAAAAKSVRFPSDADSFRRVLGVDGGTILLVSDEGLAYFGYVCVQSTNPKIPSVSDPQSDPVTVILSIDGHPITPFEGLTDILNGPGKSRDSVSMAYVSVRLPSVLGEVRVEENVPVKTRELSKSDRSALREKLAREKVAAAVALESKRQSIKRFAWISN